MMLKDVGGIILGLILLLVFFGVLIFNFDE